MCVCVFELCLLCVYIYFFFGYFITSNCDKKQRLGEFIDNLSLFQDKISALQQQAQQYAAFQQQREQQWPPSAQSAVNPWVWGQSGVGSVFVIIFHFICFFFSILFFFSFFSIVRKCVLWNLFCIFHKNLFSFKEKMKWYEVMLKHL